MYEENSMDQSHEDPNVEYVEDHTTVQSDVVDVEAEVIEPEGPVSAFERKMGVVSDLSDLAYTASTGDAQTVLRAIELFSKSQLVRFMDVTVIGPILLYYAYKGKLNPLERGILGLIGTGTVIYNLRNFMKNREVINGTTASEIKEIIQGRMD